MKRLLVVVLVPLVLVGMGLGWLHGGKIRALLTDLIWHRGKADLTRVKRSLRHQLAQKGLRPGDEVFIRIFKEESRLELWMRRRGEKRFKLARAYPVCAWSGKLGPKLKEGDRQSPEGFYEVTRRSLNPNSRYHLSFNLGYPNAYDRAHRRTGSFLMVHGSCVSIGCYAMTNAKMEEIYTLVRAALRNGQGSVPVHIFPFRMTEENLRKHADNQWIAFWRNLKTGHDLFEKHHAPPCAYVRNRQYAFRQCRQKRAAK